MKIELDIHLEVATYEHHAKESRDLILQLAEKLESIIRDECADTPLIKALQFSYKEER